MRGDLVYCYKSQKNHVDYSETVYHIVLLPKLDDIYMKGVTHIRTKKDNISISKAGGKATGSCSPHLPSPYLSPSPPPSPPLPHPPPLLLLPPPRPPPPPAPHPPHL